MIFFLFTDIESSTRLWETYRQQMVPALQKHDQILYDTIAEYGGRVIEHTGDGVYAVFEPGQPLQAAITIQRLFADQDWAPVEEIRIRIGLEGRTPDKAGVDYFPRQEGYFGPVVNLTQRIMSAGWGGQILMGSECRHLAPLPPGARIEDLGHHMLRSMKRPQQVYSLTHPDLPGREYPPLRTRSPRENNLPEPGTPFIDRQEERTTISRLLNRPECRLLNLMGPGGIGKSRLSVQVARDNLDAFSHGVFFVPLAPIHSADYILPTIADSLRLSFYNREDPEQQLAGYLREKEMLLVIDNVEHVVDGAMLFSRLLRAAPGVKILTTSRVRLNVQDEWTLDVSGMAAPRPESDPLQEVIRDYPAVALFLQSAQRILPGFVPTPAEEYLIGRICHHLEGLPLAIELAASWLRLLSVADIAREVEQGLEFLSTNWQDLPERHRSLHAVFSYSWDLLAGPEQSMLARLSLFRNGFDREAAREVAGAGLGVLNTLHDHSLIRHNRDTGRYEVHELLRQFALDQLKQQSEAYPQAMAAHGQYYLTLAATQLAQLKGAAQRDALTNLIRERQNIRTAWQWAWNRGEVDLLAGAFESLTLFHIMRSRLQDIGLFFKQAPPENSGRMAAMWHIGRGIALYNVGRYPKAKERLLAGIVISPVEENDSLTMLAHYNLGGTYLNLGEYAASQSHLRDGLEMAVALEDDFSAALHLHSLGVLHRMTGNFGEARKLHQEGLALCRNIGNQWLIGISIYMLGYIAYMCDEVAEAERLFQESLTLHEQIGDERVAAFNLNLLGNLARRRAAYDKARQLHQEALNRFTEMVERRGMTFSFLYLGQVSLILGELAAAREYLAQALQMASSLNIKPLSLQVLAAAAEVLIAQEDLAQAQALLQLVEQHPAGEQTTREQARNLLEKINGQAPDQQPAPTMESATGRLLATWLPVAASSGDVIL